MRSPHPRISARIKLPIIKYGKEFRRASIARPSKKLPTCRRYLAAHGVRTSEIVLIGSIEHESRMDDACLPGLKGRWKKIGASSCHSCGFQVLPPSRIRSSSLPRPPFAGNKLRHAATQYRQLVRGEPHRGPRQTSLLPCLPRSSDCGTGPRSAYPSSGALSGGSHGKDGVWHG